MNVFFSVLLFETYFNNFSHFQPTSVSEHASIRDGGQSNTNRCTNESPFVTLNESSQVLFVYLKLVCIYVLLFLPSLSLLCLNVLSQLTTFTSRLVFKLCRLRQRIKRRFKINSAPHLCIAKMVIHCFLCRRTRNSIIWFMCVAYFSISSYL
jgi:hypothetical protein